MRAQPEDWHRRQDGTGIGSNTKPGLFGGSTAGGASILYEGHVISMQRLEEESQRMAGALAGLGVNMATGWLSGCQIPLPGLSACLPARGWGPS